MLVNLKAEKFMMRVRTRFRLILWDMKAEILMC